jgi:hypothetical protein
VPVSWTAPAAAGVVIALLLTIWWGVQGQTLLEQAQQSVLGLL